MGLLSQSHDKFILLFSFRIILRFQICRVSDISACFICTYQLFPFFEHITAALRTSDIGRLLPCHKLTVRMVDAAVITASLFGLLDDNISAAIRTDNPCLFKIRFCVPALRESGAGQEFTVRTVFDYHPAAAVFANDVGLLIADLNFLKFLLGGTDRFFQIRPKIADNGFPLQRSFFHRIQECFHIRCEVYIHNARKGLLHHLINNFTQFCDIQFTLLSGNISAIDDGRDCRRV